MLLNEPCLELYLNQTWLQIYIEKNRNQLHGKFETNNLTARFQLVHTYTLIFIIRYTLTLLQQVTKLHYSNVPSFLLKRVIGYP